MAEQTSPVLFVDDEWSMIQVMTAILRRAGYENVEAAFDGATALRMLREGSYSLIMSDLSMQPMGGLDLLRSVRADSALAATPFIMTTASSAAEPVLRAKRLGADH